MSYQITSVAAGVLLSLTFLTPTHALAQTFRWVDNGGTVHYSSQFERVPEQYRGAVRGVWDSAAPDLHSPISAAAPTVIRFTRGAAIVVMATINGVGPVALILDTGADRTMVSPVALRRLRISLPPAGDVIVRGVTGMRPALLSWIDSLTVGHSSVGPLAVIVHDPGLRPADGLLGRDFLSLFTLTIDAHHSTVTLKVP